MAKTKKTQNRRTRWPNYDSAWKEVIESLFEYFLEFLFPQIHQDIDFSRGVEVLSNDLRRIIPQGKVGNRHADVLVKVYLKMGSPRFFCVFIHVEIQGPGQVAFMIRIFEYYYRIFEKYKDKGAEIVSLAVFIDDDPDNRPDTYHFAKWGFEHLLKIPSVKITDFKYKKEFIEKLETSKNPMALVVKVQLKSMEVKKEDVNKKFDMKRELTRELFQHGYDKRFIRSLFYFIDSIMPLPEKMESIVTNDVNQYQEENNMTPILNLERIAKKNGKKEALRETVVELLKNGGSMELILKSIKLPKKEIEKLAATVH